MRRRRQAAWVDDVRGQRPGARAVRRTGSSSAKAFRGIQGIKIGGGGATRISTRHRAGCGVPVRLRIDARARP
eukprot:7389373-Prymnesium_polylepis.2